MKKLADIGQSIELNALVMPIGILSTEVMQYPYLNLR